MDNIFIERLWRSLKYEAVYLHEMTDGFAAERVISTWIDFYNTKRPYADGSLLDRPICGYDGQGKGLAHIPTGPTPTKSIESD